FLPLIWLLTVTMTSGVQKIFHPSNPRIGFLTQARNLDQKAIPLEQAVASAKASGNKADIEAASKALRSNRVERFNNILDAFVAGAFMMLVATITALSAREWILLL